MEAFLNLDKYLLGMVQTLILRADRFEVHVVGNTDAEEKLMMNMTFLLLGAPRRRIFLRLLGILQSTSALSLILLLFWLEPFLALRSPLFHCP